MTGTLTNAGAVMAGSLLGLLIHRKMPEKLLQIIFQAVGLFTLFLGFSMALKVENILLMIFSLILGSAFGEILNLEKKLTAAGDRLKNRLKLRHEKFSEGLLTAFLIFCIGSMTILGAIEDGLGHTPKLLYTKSVLDGFTAMALSASLGIGVLFSVIPLLIFQGSLTLFAGFLKGAVQPALIAEMSAVGGVLIIGIGLSILEIKKIRVTNMIPALFFTVGLYYLFRLF